VEEDALEQTTGLERSGTGLEREKDRLEVD
jgi:hypothetical protein